MQVVLARRCTADNDREKRYCKVQERLEIEHELFCTTPYCSHLRSSLCKFYGMLESIYFVLIFLSTYTKQTERIAWQAKVHCITFSGLIHLAIQIRSLRLINTEMFRIIIKFLMFSIEFTWFQIIFEIPVYYNFTEIWRFETSKFKFLSAASIKKSILGLSGTSFFSPSSSLEASERSESSSDSESTSEEF